MNFVCRYCDLSELEVWIRIVRIAPWFCRIFCEWNWGNFVWPYAKFLKRELKLNCDFFFTAVSFFGNHLPQKLNEMQIAIIQITLFFTTVNFFGDHCFFWYGNVMMKSCHGLVFKSFCCCFFDVLKCFAAMWNKYWSMFTLFLINLFFWWFGIWPSFSCLEMAWKLWDKLMEQDLVL